ncbi:MAG: 30S ribosomal protein S1 [Candidatus Levybacteria bacterium]|nr:30S ribosomal protein S1 [Candidatus Levybacteria bacterium]
MAQLLKSVTTTLPTIKRGERIVGTITKLTPAEILVDINAKTEAVVLEKDKKILRSILSLVKLGDTVTVSILSPESDLGHPVVSLRRHMEDMTWEKLLAQQKKQEPLHGQIVEVTRGGFVVEADWGASGFLPNSQIKQATREVQGEQTNLIGKKFPLYILELNRILRKVIFSQRKAMGIADFEEAVAGLTIGQKLSAEITNVTPFGVFVLIHHGNNQLDGLIHISEISWEKLSEVPAEYSPGIRVEVVILRFDKEVKRVELSIKRLTEDPYEKVLKKHTIDQKVTGQVININNAGVVLALPEGIEGFIRKEKIPPTVTYKEGDSVNATVSQIDIQKHRLILVPVLLRKTIGYR